MKVEEEVGDLFEVSSGSLLHLLSTFNFFQVEDVKLEPLDDPQLMVRPVNLLLLSI